MRLRKRWHGPTWWPPEDFHRSLGPGLHFVIPGVQSVGAPIDLREQVVLLTSQPIITSDNQAVTVETLVSFQVTNPQAAVECGDQKQAVERLVSAVLLGAAGHRDLPQILASRDQLDARMREKLDSLSDQLGVQVNLAEVRSICPEPMAASAGQRSPHPRVTGAAPDGRPERRSPASGC